MSWAIVLTTTAFYAIYPVTITANILLTGLRALAIPCVHVLLCIFRICIVLPLRFLLKFEPLYIFLSVAGAVGVSAGISLHFLSGYIHQLLNINPGSEDNEFPNSKSKTFGDGSSNSRYLPSPGQKSKRGGGKEDKDRTGMRGLWRLPGFKIVRGGKEVAKWENGNEHKKEIENRSGSEWIYKGKRGKENLLVTMILEEDEEDDDDGEGNMYGNDDDDDDDYDERYNSLSE
ncbi:hypothetical protein ACJ73_09464 [Blastomyces percursus]|uniref:Uncharacterized protein n=1 Tax=Blastomyces percursus TaxID=1658174 RepID=A0A1J9P6S9_9EURO|nr:hypothetical protein ACJ73_09464 [Blastomyces percursus]